MSILYHNPRCSKSRQTLALLEENNASFDVVRYLETPPSVEKILEIIEGLGGDPIALIRVKEALFKELGLNKTDERSAAEWAQILHANPKLIERPVFEHQGKFALGRPPEQVLELL